MAEVELKGLIIEPAADNHAALDDEIEAVERSAARVLERVVPRRDRGKGCRGGRSVDGGARRRGTRGCRRRRGARPRLPLLRATLDESEAAALRRQAGTVRGTGY